MKRLRYGGVLIVVGCSLPFALLASYGYERGYLSPRQLGISFLLLVGLVFALVAFGLTRGQLAQSQPPLSNDKPPLTVTRLRTLNVAVVFSILVLFVAAWETRGGPLLPRIVGAVINILFASSLVFLPVRAKRKAK